MIKRPAGYLGGTTAQFIELGERLAELERQDFQDQCLDLAKAMQDALKQALAENASLKALLELTQD